MTVVSSSFLARLRLNSVGGITTSRRPVGHVPFHVPPIMLTSLWPFEAMVRSLPFAPPSRAPSGSSGRKQMLPSNGRAGSALTASIATRMCRLGTVSRRTSFFDFAIGLPLSGVSGDRLSVPHGRAGLRHPARLPSTCFPPS